MTNLITALRKLAFCFAITANRNSFWRLVVNTKKYTLARNAEATAQGIYAIKFKKQLATIYLRTFTGDLQIFYDVFWKNIYQLPEEIFLDAKVIIDLGAHTGMSSLYFHCHAPQARIYSVEADEDNYRLLRKNSSSVALHAAIGNQKTMYVQKTKKSYNSYIATKISGDPVRGIMMTELLTEQGIGHIDILKVDIEGAERYLFEGDTGWMMNTENILIELHDASLVEKFEALAREYGFTVERREIAHENIYFAYKH